ncbi:Phenylalanine--tRNA ligase beta subunit [Candidatus Ornithobacterium hominis]|uniref:Phenylalanine--tRNA ligase beta subunit n=1 Tax=Candidatus Ornithobacterium hominis TaxID=2497989 RepID=A0A383U2K1_9FLAO|nr:phenylalanine--tRNA ligase subunit beta [Candidatus Ornithobacterium hominis]MCT7905049.1 phenylalanine--tRNA ligase subunit beta [Candidatus Ornithobacterium hominis]SZD74114.1 Phenylalanine--tRNA ligase beta subunit [Candidatus Ornithobacterium hominis]
MKISYDWLREYIQTDLSIDKIAEVLTDIGLEVEGVEKIGVDEKDLEGFVVGEVIECLPHPNADKLKITQVDLGQEFPVQIVCGAPNVAAGQKVPVATIGTLIKSADGSSFEIKKAKLRGESSHGMICSEKELNVSDNNDGIWVLDKNLPAGKLMKEVIDTSLDYMIEIGLTPNRADAMSHFGVARDLHAALSAKKLASQLKIPFLEEIENTVGPFQIEIENEELCPAYYGAYIENVEIKESPQWLKKRLHAIGIKPSNNVVDITNYILHGLGQPLHAFDADTIAHQKIIVKTGFEENLKVLDQTEKKLEKTDLIISDENKPLAIAGVMGGLDSSVKNSTKNIFLESAYFKPTSIRKTAKRLGINSDASFRYERGIDPNITGLALEKAIQLILEVGGGVLVQKIKNRPREITDFDVILKYRNLDLILGERIHRQKIKEILELLSIEIISENNDFLELKVPAYRVDVQREIDVIEEILRIYGYNSIPKKEKVSFSIVKGEGFERNDFINRLSDYLVSCGFFEAMNISMYSEKYDTKQPDTEKSIRLINSLSQDYNVMRRSLLPELIQNIQFNINRKNENLRLFEIGHAYEKTANAYQENFRLALAVSGKSNTQHWQNKETELDLFYLKGIIEALFQQLGIQKINFTQENQTLKIQLNRKEIGVLKVISNGDKNYKLSQNVVAAEIELQPIFEAYQSQQVKFSSIPKFPLVTRDLALLLDKQIQYEEILKTIHQLQIQEVKNISLFDVFEGEQLKDKKSYAIRLEILNPSKTMTDHEIDQIMNKVITQLQKQLKANLR